MNRIAVIATHHKAGTVWMSHTFRMIGEALGIRFLPTLALMALPQAEQVPPLILNAGNAREGVAGLFDRDEVRIFHLIRDPRDILISGMHYHLDASEKWLLRPEPKFDGRNYREMLNAQATARARYAFEMLHGAAKTFARLGDWNYGRTNGRECRYEDLVRDTQGALFSRIVSHLGFSEQESVVCGEVFWRHAIFGGVAKYKAQGRQVAHVRSGEPEQWREVFDRGLGEAFLARTGGLLVKLGYEKDTSWLEDLPEYRAELDA